MNKMDEAMGLISLSVSNSLQFHRDEFFTPQEMWDKFNDLFDTINEFRALQIEAKLTSLIPNVFPSIEDFLMGFKQQRTLLQGCGKEKTYKECIYLILSKLRGNFQIFFSTFHSIMDALGPRFTMPTFEVFCDRLTREQTTLTQLDTITNSNTQALVAQTSTGKQKQKMQSKTDSTGNEISSNPTPKLDAWKPSQKGKSFKFGESSSKTQKYRGAPCSFCGKEGHLVSLFWKYFEALEEAMQQHNIASLKQPQPPSGKRHALSA